MAEFIFGEKLENVEYVIRPSVYGLAFQENGLLGLVEVKGKTGYFLPGGGKEAAETDEACLTREFWEELGAKIKINAFIGSAEHYSYCTPLNCYLRVIGYYYFADIIESITGKIEEEHSLIWLKADVAVPK